MSGPDAVALHFLLLLRVSLQTVMFPARRSQRMWNLPLSSDYTWTKLFPCFFLLALPRSLWALRFKRESLRETPDLGSAPVASFQVTSQMCWKNLAFVHTHRPQLSSNPNSPKESYNLSQVLKVSKSVMSDSKRSGDNLDITFENQLTYMRGCAYQLVI